MTLPKYYIVYHNADKEGLPSSNHEDDWWMHTKKPEALKSIGSFCFFVVGETILKEKVYSLRAFFKIERCDVNGKNDFDVYGQGFTLNTPTILNNLPFFDVFFNKDNKHFGHGFKNISNSRFTSTLYNSSPEIDVFVKSHQTQEATLNTKNRYLDPEKAWDLILDQADKAFFANDLWESPKLKRLYAIKTKPEKIITISRQSDKTDSILRRQFVVKRINEINESDGSIDRVSWTGHVAKMAAIVHLHPYLRWGDNFETIFVSNIPKPSYKGFGEAPNDDPQDLQNFARKVRRGQPKFRRILLQAYDQKCCVTGCNVAYVLDACHISPHALGGENKTENGLLMRTDVHNLFDEGVIQIAPVNRIIHVHPKLKNSEYWQYDGIKLADRIDGKEPSTNYLIDRWNIKSW